MMQDLRTLARSGRGKEPVVSTIVALVFGRHETEERCGMRIEARA